MSYFAFNPEDIPVFMDMCPKFTGENMTADAFFNKMDEIGKIAHWDDRLLLHIARLQFVGKAAEAMAHEAMLNGKEYTYATYKERVIRFFGVCSPGKFNFYKVQDAIFLDYIKRLRQETEEKSTQVDPTATKLNPGILKIKVQVKGSKDNYASIYGNNISVNDNKKVENTGEMSSKNASQENVVSAEKQTKIEQDTNISENSKLANHSTEGYKHSAPRESSKECFKIDTGNKSSCSKIVSNESSIIHEETVGKDIEGSEDVTCCIEKIGNVGYCVEESENVACCMEETGNVACSVEETESSIVRKKHVDLIDVSVINANATAGDDKEVRSENLTKETGSLNVESNNKRECSGSASLTRESKEAGRTPPFKKLKKSPQDPSKPVATANSTKEEIQGARKLANDCVAKGKNSYGNSEHIIRCKAKVRSVKDDKHKKCKEMDHGKSKSQSKSKASEMQKRKNSASYKQQKCRNSRGGFVNNCLRHKKKYKYLGSKSNVGSQVKKQKCDTKDFKAGNAEEYNMICKFKILRKNMKRVIKDSFHSYKGYCTKQMRIENYGMNRKHGKMSLTRKLKYQGFSPHRKRKVKKQ